jgi:hypothetical protein
MHWCKAFRASPLLALVALSCAEEPLTPPRVDSAASASQGEQASVVDAGDAPFDGASSRDAHASDAGPSCQEQSTASGLALQNVLAMADQSCSRDDDCVAGFFGSDCWFGCGFYASQSANERLQAEVARQKDTICAGYGERGCSQARNPCARPPAAACIGGECRAAPDVHPANDAGSSKPPLLLDGSAVMDAQQPIQLAVGQRFELTLHTIGGGNYGDPQLSSEALHFAESLYPTRQNPGGPTQVYVFEAVAAGEVVITIAHSVRPEPFKLTVTVR